MNTLVIISAIIAAAVLAVVIALISKKRQPTPTDRKIVEELTGLVTEELVVEETPTLEKTLEPEVKQQVATSVQVEEVLTPKTETVTKPTPSKPKKKNYKKKSK